MSGVAFHQPVEGKGISHKFLNFLDTTNLDNATSYCSSLNLKSLTDWRLPTKVELASLIDTSVSAPKIVSELVSTTESLYYWSSTSHSGNRNWGVNFNAGSVGGYAEGTDMHVRCARDGS